ncbi:hypothetical protein IV203_037755 [Nitzschia inconspicua]|uniref:Phosphatidylinositol-specific phospholipase C X domain-containing protein n=1 Tax=Nitzschia inconspicua TaxID=303405 RepID=A0A9K3LLI9_9STRA|nr:hypothetical protein IV203_037755 [Nitzschia inconspicua]
MGSDLEKWTEIYGPIIHQLPLNKLCLVETHDSGTFRMKSPIVAPWATTQHATIEEQLQGGVRVLDLRLGCDGPQTYLLVHGMWRTVTSLNDALCSGWYPSVTTIAELKMAIGEGLQDASKKTGLWTVGAVIAATPFRKVPQIPQLLAWFLPGQDWTERVNIIQADFVMEIDLVPNAIAQCVLNAMEDHFFKESLNTRLPRLVESFTQRATT